MIVDLLLVMGEFYHQLIQGNQELYKLAPTMVSLHIYHYFYSGYRLSEVQEPHPQPPKSKRGGQGSFIQRKKKLCAVGWRGHVVLEE